MLVLFVGTVEFCSAVAVDRMHGRAAYDGRCVWRAHRRCAGRRGMGRRAFVWVRIGLSRQAEALRVDGDGGTAFLGAEDVAVRILLDDIQRKDLLLIPLQHMGGDFRLRELAHGFP